MRRVFRIRTSAKRVTEVAAEETAWSRIQHCGNWNKRSVATPTYTDYDVDVVLF